MAQPDVIVDFVFQDGLFFAAVSNIGADPALAVEVKFDPAFKGLGGTVEISALGMFKKIEFLAPGRVIRTLVDSSTAYFARQEPERITVAIAYADRSGKKYTAQVVHDLSIYRTVTFLSKER